MIGQIASVRSQLTHLSDRELTNRVRSIQFRIRSGTPLDRVQVDVFALATEAIHRTLGIQLYPVQLYAGLLLYRGVIAEMQTGEGKTVTAVAPVVLRALEGQGCHVMTSNGYLAQRDAKKLRPAYELLGLTVDCVHADLEKPDRRKAYQADITYGTASEFGFDYLRDRLELNGREEPGAQSVLGTASVADTVQRGRHFALIDEADSILLDEGRTPLIIALPNPSEESLPPLLHWARNVALHLAVGVDFVFDPKSRAAHLTDSGCRRVLLAPRPPAAWRYDIETVFRRVEIALQAELVFQRDREYLVKDDEVSIVDESTGRSLDGRRWQHGLHQAMEIKEGLAPTEEHGIAARITLQRFIRLYKHSCGMTGTARTASKEFRKLYSRRVCRIPTNRPNQRRALPARVFATLADKYEAIATSIEALRDQGRAVLVGTPSIQASEQLSERLSMHGIVHRLLNARQDAEEAAIVGDAGHARRVTIATNMAGRGTDIELEDDVRAAGGLHVIATEVHTSQRIDRQLIGRSARQGDPGSYQFMVSMEDELFDQVPDERRLRWQQQARKAGPGEISRRRWLPLFYRVQKMMERRHARDRRSLQKSEKTRWKTARNMGLDPTLDLVEDT
ncbi:translocase [bacterium]|nr:translocase [bacterium]